MKFKKVALVAAMMSVLSTNTSAGDRFSIESGVSNVFDGADGGVINIGWEQESIHESIDGAKFPWTADVAYYTEYDKSDSTITEHFGLYVGKQWPIEVHNNIRVKLGFGGAAFTDTSDANSSTFTFYESVGLELFEDFEVTYRHSSNAGLSGENDGEDTLLFGYRVDF